MAEMLGVPREEAEGLLFSALREMHYSVLPYPPTGLYHKKRGTAGGAKY